MRAYRTTTRWLTVFMASEMTFHWLLEAGCPLSLTAAVARAKKGSVATMQTMSQNMPEYRASPLLVSVLGFEGHPGTTRVPCEVYFGEGLLAITVIDSVSAIIDSDLGISEAKLWQSFGSSLEVTSPLSWEIFSYAPEDIVTWYWDWRTDECWRAGGRCLYTASGSKLSKAGAGADTSNYPLVRQEFKDFSYMHAS